VAIRHDLQRLMNFVFGLAREDFLGGNLSNRQFPCHPASRSPCCTYFAANNRANQLSISSDYGQQPAIVFPPELDR
jgi:hypothetical protein